MAITGGGDRRELRPLLPDGNYRRGYYGSHRGAAESLNARVPPGMVPYWCRTPQSDRGMAQLQRFENEGWEVAPPGSQIKTPRTHDARYSQLGLDSYRPFGDLVLLQIPEEKYRRRQENLARLRDNAIEGPTRQYLHRGEGAQQAYGANAEGPIYYRGAGHGRSSQ
jgi:hypothetical protein